MARLGGKNIFLEASIWTYKYRYILALGMLHDQFFLKTNLKSMKMSKNLKSKKMTPK